MFAIPAIPLQGYSDFSSCSHERMFEAQLVENLHLLTYDEILHLLDEIESGELEKKCSFSNWEKITHFLFTLANAGFQGQGAEFEATDLEQIYALANDQSYIISHTVYYGDGDMFYSKTSCASAWQNTKDFCQKHKTAIIKDLAQENVNSSSFREKARELGSYLSHEALHGVSELTSPLPELQQELVDLSGQFLPQGIIPEESKCPKDNFEEWIAQGHKKIDEIFSTDHADYYTSGARSEKDSQYTIGIIPPSGKLLNIGSKELKSMAKSGEIADRAGFTITDRSSMKHGYRRDSVYPKPVGNVKQINEHGQKILESILNHPEKEVYEIYRFRHGTVIEVVAPGKGGARFTTDGQFIHFMEP